MMKKITISFCLLALWYVLFQNFLSPSSSENLESEVEEEQEVISEENEDREPTSVAHQHRHVHSKNTKRGAKSSLPVRAPANQSGNGQDDQTRLVHSALLKEPDEVKARLAKYYPEASFSFSQSQSGELYRVLSPDLESVNASSDVERKSYAQNIHDAFVSSGQFLFLEKEKEGRKVSGNIHREDYMQTCQGHPVYGTYIALTYSSTLNRVTLTNVNLFDFPCKDIDMSMDYDQKQAQGVVEDEFHAVKIEPVTEKSVGGKVVWANSKPSVFGWYFQVETKDPVDVIRVVVSAKSGKILMQQSVAIIE